MSEHLLGQIAIHVSAPHVDNILKQFLPRGMSCHQYGRDPSLGVFCYLFRFLVGNIQVVALFGQRLDLLGGESELLNSQPGDLPGSSEPGQVRYRGQRPRRDDHVAIFRYIAEKMGQELVYLILVIQAMIVIKHEEEVLGYLLIDLIDQGGYQRIHVAPHINGAMEGCRGFRSKPGIGPLYGSDQMIEKDTGILIEWVEGVPAYREVGIVGEVRQERCLAVACGS